MSLYPMPAPDTKRNAKRSAKRTLQTRASQGETLTQLVVRAQGGDMRSFDALVARFQDRAVGKSAAILGDAFGAQDVAQEAFVEAYRRLGELKIAAAFPSLLEALIRKHCDRVTRRRRFVTVSLGEPSGIADTLPADASADPARHVVAEAQRESVREAVRALPESEREIILLFYVGGQSHKEIAASLHLPVSTVKSRLHEGRVRLKRRMIPMIEETLAAENPSQNERFQEKVRRASRIVSYLTYWRDGETRPDPADLEREREEIEKRAAEPDPLDFETAQRGVWVIGRQCGDYPTAADFLERYLSQGDLTPSQEVWARYEQLSCLNMGYGRTSGVLRHRTFLNWLHSQIEQMILHNDDRLTINGSGFPVATDAPDRLPNDCLMLWAIQPTGVNVSWGNAGRAAEWLDLAEKTLLATPRNAAARELRRMLFFTMSVLLHREGRQAEELMIVERLNELAEEAEAEERDWRTPRWRSEAAYRRTSILLKYALKAAEKAGDAMPTMPLAEIEEVIKLKDAWEPLLEGDEWDKRYALATARVECAYLLRDSGQHERAIALFEQVFDAQFGYYYSYFECAASLWLTRRDRTETLALLRRAVPERGTSDPLKRFKDEKHFADIHDDAEFLAALSAEP